MVDSTIMVAPNNLKYEQSKSTDDTNQAAQKLLDYLATHPNTDIRYHESKMRLTVHSDTSYLSVTKSCICAGGHSFLKKNNNAKNLILHNGTILTIAGILKHAMASAAEAEVCGLFINVQNEAILITTLENWQGDKNHQHQ